MITETIGVQLVYSKDTEAYTTYDTKLEIEQAISKLLFSLFHQGKLVDFRIVDKDYDGMDNVNARGEIMTREEAIKILKSKMDGHTDTSYEWAETVRMAVKALEQEPTTKNDLAQERYQDLIEYFGDEKVAKTILESRKEFKAWLERLRWNVKKADELARELEQIKETTKNDSAVDHTINGLDDFIEFGRKAFGVELTVKKSDNPDTYVKLFGTTKNDLGVDCVSREDALTCLTGEFEDREYEPSELIKIFSRRIKAMPSVTPQEPRWIPVSEKLPNDRDWYLGIFKEPDTGWINPLPFICDYVGRETKATTKEYWILRGFTDMDEHIGYYFNLECVAWMPLPQSYSEVEE